MKGSMNAPNVLWMSSLLEGKLYKMDRNWSKRQQINYVFIMWSMIFPHHPLWLLQKNARLLGMFHFLSALSLRMASLNRGVQIFSSKKPTKLVSFRQILQRCQTKNEPFGLPFCKEYRQKFEGSDSGHLWGCG